MTRKTGGSDATTPAARPGGSGAARWPVVGRAAVATRFVDALVARQPGGWLLTGPSGIGKTTLLHTCAEAARAAGYQVLHARGTRTEETVPFAALARLLPGGVRAQRNPLDLLGAVVETLATQASTEPTLLCLDDAHLVHPTTATALQQVTGKHVPSHPLALLLTASSLEALPAPLAHLLTEGRLTQEEVGPLEQQHLRMLALRMLGAPLQRRSEEEVWNLTRGHPLLLRALVEPGAEDGGFELVDGSWRHTEQLLTNPAAVAAVELAVRDLTAQERCVLDVLAVGGPLALELLTAICDDAAIESLERRTLLVIEQVAHRSEVSFRWPLYGAVLRERLPRMRVRALHLELAAVLEATGARCDDDLLKLGAWKLGAGERWDRSLALRAATVALDRGDPRLAEGLARQILEQAASFDGSLTLGQALAAQGKEDEAAAVLASLGEQASCDDRRTRLAVLRASLPDALPHGASVEVLEAAASEVSDPDLRDELDAVRATALAQDGQLSASISVARSLARRPAGDERRHLAVLVTSTLAQTLIGQPHAALADIDAGLALLDDGVETALPLVRTRLLLNRRLALSLLGRLEEAEALAGTCYREAAAEAGREVVGAWALNVAIAVLERGRVGEARQILREALLDLDRQDPLDQLPLAVAVRGYAATQAGDLPAARAALEEHDRRWGPRPAHAFRSWLGRTRAWVAALEGDRTAALRHLEETLDDNRLAGEFGWSPAALHDGARLGEAAAVVDELSALAARSPSPLVDAFAAHARGTIEAAGDLLEDAGRRLADARANLLAAESFQAAATAHRRAGHEAAARRAGVRCQLLIGRCKGADTPALQDLPEQLTPRELEVARLAAGGRSSREIAERLHLSVRTIDNHLYRVYEKLHLDGREQLGGVLCALPS